MPYVGQKPADIISTAVDTVTGKFSGEIDAASLDISGNIDVDGTSNLDIVDIDGAVNIATTALITGVLTTTAVPLFNGGIDLPNVNTFIKGGGHNVVQVDSSKTYYYGGTDGIQFRSADNASALITMDNAGRWSFVNGNVVDMSSILVYSTLGSGGIAIQITPSGNHAYVPMKLRNSSGGEIGTIACSTSGTAYNTSSDYRLKENVSYSFDATSRLKQLKPARFNFIADADTTVDGFLAHEVSSIVPEAITGEKDATESMDNVILNADGTRLTDDVSQEKWVAGKANETYASDTTWVASQTVPKYQGIDQSKLVPLLVKALQELSEKVETLTLHSSVLEQEAGYHLDNLILDGTNGSSADAGDDIILG